jgi:hypothetical protein
MHTITRLGCDMVPCALASKLPRSRGTSSAGLPRSCPRLTGFLARSFRTATQALRCMATSPRSTQAIMNQLTFLSAEPHANRLASPASEKEWLTSVATWRLSIFAWLTDCGPVGWFGRTCPASCRRTEDGTLVPFSGAWASSGMGSPTECLTLNTSDWPSDANVCSLSDILETGDVPQRYYLSPTACAGILRRAVKRGKELPRQLLLALRAVASMA